MCGIVAYFGGAGNSLTRLLTAMSAIIYRAPDSTGIGVFGDDREPIRLRRSLGSVVQWIQDHRGQGVYACPEASYPLLLTDDPDGSSTAVLQERLLALEGFEPPSPGSRPAFPGFDALVDLACEPPVRLEPGCAGRSLFRPRHRIRSRKELSALIPSLIAAYDLSPVTIQTLIRSALADTVEKRRSAGLVEAETTDILAEFDELFETTQAGARIKRLRHRAHRHLPKTANARKQLWQCLIETVIRIPEDFDRDAVVCLFRLIDAALVSRIPGEPGLSEALDRKLEGTWPPSSRPRALDWRSWYGLEKGLNVFGRAAAAALAHLREAAFPSPAAETSEATETARGGCPVPGHTDPVLLRYLATPVIAHGRWAMQSAVTVGNAHPFADAERRRAVALNGQFDSRVEARLRTFLETAAGCRLRSENSAEYVSMLWGHFYHRLRSEKRRSDLVRKQVEQDMADISVCGPSIDFGVYHRVRDRSPEDLDRMAFVAATRQIIQNGGQIAVVGISLESPRRLYVATHNRPVFVVRRLENEDFMVVSDVNAALGLFPQVLIDRTVMALEDLKKRQTPALPAREGTEGPPVARGSSHGAMEMERERLLEPFAVEVHPLDGEEILAVVETRLQGGAVRRCLTISDLDGNPLPDVDAFETRLDPVTIRKDVDRSFHESHLMEVPERFRYILGRYRHGPDGEGPGIELNTRALRRRFGPRLEGLRRLALVGTGSAFHMAAVGGARTTRWLPKMGVEVLRPGDIADVKRHFQPHQDLVILLSWSSTTAEMVQLARRLLENDVLTIAVTEKRFADMALAAARSAGVLPVFSGEEITVAGIKSTLCMLLCLDLLVTWLGGQKGWEGAVEPALHRLGGLPNRLEGLIDDPEVVAFCRQTAAAAAGADAFVVIGPANARGTGLEMALKLEEASWYAVSRWYAFEDVLQSDPASWSPRRFAFVLATQRTRIEAAAAVMERLEAAGIDFAVVSCPNRQQDRIDRLCPARCLVLPLAEEDLQPYLDLAVVYRLALDVGLACGHGPGTGPRNRAKSTTVTRSRSRDTLSPAGELKRLAATTPEAVRSTLDTGDSRVFRWEDGVVSGEARTVFGDLRRLADGLCRKDSPEVLGLREPADASELGRLLFDARTQVDGVVMAPLDTGALYVVQDASAVWGRMTGLPIRILPPGDGPKHYHGDSLTLLVATAPAPPTANAIPASKEAPVAWIGPEPPSRLSGKTLGTVVIPSSGGGQCPPVRSYVGLLALLAHAWLHHDREKATIFRDSLAGAAEALYSVLDDERLLAELRRTAASNGRYRTALFVSPSACIGRAWEACFDAVAPLMVVHHPPGHSGHGPIVTIDGRVDEKYVALERRSDMMDRFGTTMVERWEAGYLAGATTDEFLSGPPPVPPSRPGGPFPAGGRWYIPELVPTYDTRQDNLVILDMTGERDLPVMLDELSLLGSRFPRLVILTQEERLREAGEKAFFSAPVGDMLILPSPRRAPVADLHLPVVLEAVGAALADVWRAQSVRSHHGPGK
jgi:glucosamine 6-phosphate synthetase-like amidotransferase/phosphosugar isomerase protein